MANIKSAKKRAKQAEVRRERNRAGRTEYRTVLKKARKALEAGEGAAPAVKDASSTLASSARKGLIHKNTAARLKSRLAKRLNKKAS